MKHFEKIQSEPSKLCRKSGHIVMKSEVMSLCSKVRGARLSWTVLWGKWNMRNFVKCVEQEFTSKNSFPLYILVIKSTLDLVYYNHTIFCQLWTWHGCIDINSESWVPLTTDYKSKEIKVAMENLIEGRENCFWLYPYQHAWSAPRNKHNVRRNKAEYRITFA